MSAASVAFRMARRGTALSVRHAVLILLIVTLPVAGLSMLVLVEQSSIATTAETVTNQFGHTQTQLTPLRSPDPTARQQGVQAGYLSGAVRDDGRPKHPDTGELVDPATLLPPGIRVLSLADSTAQVHNGEADATITLPVTLGDAADAAFTGRIDLVSGRAPRGDREVVADQAALDRLGIRVGDHVAFVQPVQALFTVVGVLADHRYPSSRSTLFLPSDAYDGTVAEPSLRNTVFYLPDVDVTWAQSVTFNHAGIGVESRALVDRFGAGDSTGSLNAGLYVMYFAMIGVLAAFLIALLAGSAFSIGARSRQRSLALVAATGGSRGLLFGLMVSTGAIIGAVAGALGVGLGIAGGSLWMSLTADGTLIRYAGFHLTWWSQLLVFGYAVLVGVIAAAVPAVVASRTDVVAALRGARRPTKTSRRRPVVGAVMVIAGVVVSIGSGAALSVLNARGLMFGGGNSTWVDEHYAALQAAGGYALAGGIILTQLGLLLCAALVVGWTARIIERTGVAARLAGRDLMRNAGRAVPAIGAIMATSFLAVFAAGMMTSSNATAVADYKYQLQHDQVLVPAETGNGTKVDLTRAFQVVRAAVPVRAASLISGAAAPDYSVEASDTLYARAVVPAGNVCPSAEVANGSTGIAPSAADPLCRDVYANGVTWNAVIPNIVVGDEADLALVLGHAPSHAATTALANGDAVALHSQLVADGEITIGWSTQENYGRLGNTVNFTQRHETLTAVYEPGVRETPMLVFLSPAAAVRVGIRPMAAGVLVQLKSVATQEQQDAIDGAVQRLSGDTSASALFELGPQTGREVGQVVAVLAAAALLALCAAGVALALARSDGRRDVEVLDAVGAAPGIRRHYAVWQAVVITGVGMLLGAITGTIAVFALEGTSASQLFVMPWASVGVALVATTAVMAAISWLTAGRLRTRGIRAAIA